MCKIFILILLFIVTSAHAQDLTGVWQGHFRSSNMATRSSLFDDRYKFEVQIAQHDKSLEAVTYSYLSSLFYGKAAAAGTVNPKTSKVLIQEGKLLEVRNQTGDVCIMTCFLQYSKSGDEEFLEGTFVSMNTRDSSNCGRGTVFLRKVLSSDFYKEPFLEKEENLARANPSRKPAAAAPGTVKKPPIDKPKTGDIAARKPSDVAASKPKMGDIAGSKRAGDVPAAKPTTPVKKPTTIAKAPSATPSRPEPKTPAPAPLARISTPQATQPAGRMDSSEGMGKKFATITPRVLQTRANPLVKTIIVHTNEVVLNIYDDGAIDHDTVSVYLDNRQVIARAMLTDRPLTVTVHLDESQDYHELVMVAENEGEIPPNTSLMIVKAGDKEYEVRITTTEQKNAKVVFKFEKLK
ncbi:MAG: hypothetical protein ABUM51_01685 [Bacteroidota bacterium]